MIRITNGALDVLSIDGIESIVLRGVIDPLSLKEVKVAPYQREALGASKIRDLKRALQTSRVPDIDLGMRGDGAQEIEESGTKVWILQDDVFVIDGYQRKTAGEELVNDEGYMPHIGVVIHFNTDEAWERKRFEALNIGQTGLNTNVILRNMAEENDGAKLMYALTTEGAGFILYNKVSWGQNMRRGDLITGITFYKTIGRLHSHLGPGKSDPRSLARGGMSKIIKVAGKGNFSANTVSLFALIDECFNIKDVAYRKMATHLKSTFLLALSGVLSDHEDFWDSKGTRLMVPADLKRKIKCFKINDPSVQRVASSSGMAIGELESMLINHINNGKRTRRLTRRLLASSEGFEEGNA